MSRPRTPQPMRWPRRRRLRVRALTVADLEGLGWLHSHSRCQHWGPAGPHPAEEMRSLVEDFGPAQLAIERDHQLIGASLVAPVAEAPPVGDQPWAQVNWSGKELPVSAGGPYLQMRALFWVGPPDRATQSTVVALSQTTLLQRLGFEAVWGLIEAGGYARLADTMSPEAYLQQVHAGTLVDDPISGLLAQEFLMRGFVSTDGPPRAIMRWEHRRR